MYRLKDPLVPIKSVFTHARPRPRTTRQLGLLGIDSGADNAPTFRSNEGFSATDYRKKISLLTVHLVVVRELEYLSEP